MVVCLIMSMYSSLYSQIIDSKQYNYIGNWYRWQGGNFITNLNIPKSAATTGRDTGAIYYKLSDSSLYTWTGSQWRIVSGAGGSVPDLQTVTDVDYITTNPLRHQAGSNFAIMYNNGGDPIVEVFSNDSVKSTQLYSYRLMFNSSLGYKQIVGGSYSVSARTLTLPDTTGTFAMGVKVNGTRYAPGPTGLIDLGTISGGGVAYTLINGATNLGSGSQVFKDTSSNKINLRSIVAGSGITVTQNANDITIASTIPANADSTAARIVRGTFAQRPAVPDTGQIYWQTDRLSGQWNYDGVKWLFNGPANRYIYFTEWAGSIITGYNTMAPSVSGSGATAIITGEQGIDDVMRFSTGTTSSGNTTVYFGQSPTIATNYDSIIVYSEYKIKIDSLGDATNDFEAFVGVPTSSSSYDYPLFGMLYSYNLNSGNFTTRTRDNNSAGITTKNTGVAVVAGTWYKIGIEIDGFARTIKFYIDDVLVTTHSGADNMPFDGNTFTGGWGFIGLLKQAGSIPRFLRNDYVFSYIIKKKYD